MTKTDEVPQIWSQDRRRESFSAAATQERAVRAAPPGCTVAVVRRLISPPKLPSSSAQLVKPADFRKKEALLSCPLMNYSSKWRPANSKNVRQGSILEVVLEGWRFVHSLTDCQMHSSTLLKRTHL
jgi:hypothetical protein